jgi:hypothetical protein
MSMENKKQTAVEWLEDIIKGSIQDKLVIEVLTSIFNQAKAMEKEQHGETFSKGWNTRERLDDLVPDIMYPEGLDYEEKQEYVFEQFYKEAYENK